ncbi:MAG TPA: tRNA (N6-threonylcarbamoyladenosine(37)-N6)-methyltransferase TrmO [Spirochaetota bacterium]|nr:tRNA (N6-threonylcarbamoyladenosine(37)-N6)-methyltransferase TrmO [Spirochaetota bacterium]HPJ34935.1 tRNA (N6-threonylcarbamoyladenosine(37)-N6)-methyltransferase TrmO [Spirochaetota bacterium]
MEIVLRPVGEIHTPFKTVENMPVQPSAGREVEAEIEIYPEFAEGLSDIEGFSHIYVIFYLNRVKNHKLRVIPFLDTVEHGIFATRSPARPNPVGLSVAELVEVKGNILRIRGVDMLDGSPVIDIKPFVPDFDHCENVKRGWFEGKAEMAVQIRSDDRFK